MSQAPTYTRSTGFADDERDNVGGRSTVDTAALDAELDALATSVNALRANQSLNQRDDGEIRDHRVKLQSLGVDVLALLTTYEANPRGDWVTATAYALKDLVSESGNTYICVTAHTSGTFATDLAAAKWMLFSLSASPSSTAVTFTPTATIASAQVQAAIEEVDTENRALSAAALAAANLALDRHIRVEDHGAVGDGVADDYTAIYNAIIAAAGRRVHFRAGKTYLVSQALDFTDVDIDLCGDGSDLPVIVQPAQAFDLFTCAASVAIAAKTLTSSVTINTRGWQPASTDGVVAGMLMEVRSSASWYHDPRPASTDVRKSELHRVAHVEGGIIYSEAGAFDGYDTSTETVTLNFYNPISVNVQNLIVRGVRPAAGIGVPARTGFVVKHAHNVRLENLCIENHLAAGISVQNSYRTSILGGYSDTSNAEATGYGVSVNGSTYTHVFGRRFFQCRRGVDVTGAIVCRHTLIEACVNTGGGENSEGETYNWEVAGAATAAFQYGFGSHGGADYTTYRGNTTNNMLVHINCRGRNEYIEGNTFIGRSRFGLIQLMFGENAYIRYNHAFAGYTGSGKADTVYDGGGNIHTRRADWFLAINSSYEGLATGTIVVEANDVEVQDKFLQFDSTAVPANLTVKNNRVRFQTSSAATPAYLLYHDGASTIVSAWSVLDNDYQRVGGAAAGRVSMYGNLESRNYLTVYHHTRTYVLFMADDTAVSIPIPETGVLDHVRVIVDSTSGSAYGNVAVVAGSTNQYAIGTPSNISNFTTALTGADGTDTDLNLSLVDGLLYVENRLGASRRILLTICHAY